MQGLIPARVEVVRMPGCNPEADGEYGNVLGQVTAPHCDQNSQGFLLGSEGLSSAGWRVEWNEMTKEHLIVNQRRKSMFRCYNRPQAEWLCQLLNIHAGGG